jgi:hypothetical protein
VPALLECGGIDNIIHGVVGLEGKDVDVLESNITQHWWHCLARYISKLTW